MFPYIPQPSWSLGPLTIYAFGVLVAIAVIVGSRVARRRARALGLDDESMQGLLTWIVAGGFLGGHVIDLLLYEPASLATDPWRLIRLWDGLGSFGGFIGAVAGAALYFARRPAADRWRYLDAIAYAFPFGWIFGRIGCALAFDHPGRPTTFFLGERYVDGVVRHNLGLDEAIFAIVIAVTFAVLGRKPRRDGTFVGALALIYAPVRFALDGLRVGDARYLGITPAQYGSIVLAIVGAIVLQYVGRSKNSESPTSRAPHDVELPTQP